MASLTVYRLKKLLTYDHSSGQFVWNISRGTKLAGSIAGHVRTDGYIQIKIDRKMYKGHQLAWLYCYEQWPPQSIDHIDNDQSNNRISNLRLCSHMQNMWNRKVHVNSTSGYKGVHKVKNKYRAHISVGGKRLSLGYFDSADLARDAYIKAAQKHFGEFARIK